MGTKPERRGTLRGTRIVKANPAQHFFQLARRRFNWITEFTLPFILPTHFSSAPVTSRHMANTQSVETAVASLLSPFSPHVWGKFTTRVPASLLLLGSSDLAHIRALSGRAFGNCSSTGCSVTCSSGGSPAAAIAGRAPGFGLQVGEAQALTDTGNTKTFDEEV